MSGPGRVPGDAPTRVLDLDALIADPATHIVICCGAGGVGKTTAAAALAVRAAEAGRRAVVLTIDPARRLAQSMGVAELDNTPRTVPGFDRAGDGALDAMMLDMKRTFDEIVLTHASPEKAEQILANPFYQSVSSSFAGTQEYMAMEKLGQLHARGAWDFIVVDTPPSRNALDFLDAPKRLGSFLDGRFLRILLAPAKTGGRAYLRVLGAGVGLVSAVLTRVLGGQFLRDVQGFVAALDTMFGGFRERAEATYRLLQAPGTAFVVVAAPEPDALREAAYFVERLEQERMPLAGLVLNRVHVSRLDRLTAERSVAAAEELEEQAGPGQRGGGPHALTAALLRLHADLVRTAGRDAHLRERFTSAYPQVPVALVPAQPGDVHDIEGLRIIGAALGGGLGVQDTGERRIGAR